MEQKHINKKAFAASINFSKTTFERRSEQIDCVLPSGLLSQEMCEEWLKKLREWERSRLEEMRKKKNGAK
jgi:hypothetical protein